MALSDRTRRLRAHGAGAAVVTLLVVMCGAAYSLLKPSMQDSGSPGSANPAGTLAVALVLGLLAGIAYAFVRGTQDERRHTAQERIEARFGSSVLAVLPASDQVARSAGRRFGSAASAHVEPQALVSEELRQLHDRLVTSADPPPRVVVVTSPTRGNGASTVALGLAVTAATYGQRVVLIDADLRHPGVARALGLIEEVGLGDVLTGRVEVRDVLQPTVVDEHLHVLASGLVPSDPSRLVGSDGMATLLRELAHEALVIVDAPPLDLGDETARTSAAADGALVVVAADSASDRELTAAVHRLDAAGSRTLGVVLNRVASATSTGGGGT